jgi:hypothetical protein
MQVSHSSEKGLELVFRSLLNKKLDWGDTLSITVKNSLKDNGYESYLIPFATLTKTFVAQACIGMVYAKPILVTWMEPMELQR